MDAELTKTTNQTVFDVNVYFVVTKSYENEEQCDAWMQQAFNKCSDWDITPEWITEKKCLKLKPGKKDVFVFETFAGEVFEKLKELPCVIVGARCLIRCFSCGEPIPEANTPIYNTAMRGIVVSPSGFTPKIKNEIQKKVEYMSGIFTKQLRSSVTHLVTDTVMSTKYERANELKIKVVTREWIDSIWKINLEEFKDANHKMFDKYMCPFFFNLVVTSTNLDKKQKEEVKRLINSNGGEFMGVLDGTKIKIVISLETTSLSDKLKFAMQNGIPCLKIEWVYDSFKAGYSLPFTNYIINTTQACSTPERSTLQEPLNFSTISIIPGDNHNAYVDETIASSTMSSTVLSSTGSTDVPVPSIASYIKVMERLNVTEAKKAGPFLDGCNIYLTGFLPNYRDKLNKILNVGSATRIDELSDALTHVIVGDPVKANQDLKIIKSKGLYPYILKVDWLEESIKIQAPAQEEHYLFNSKDIKIQSSSEVPSPLSKKNLQLLQKPKIPAVPLFNEEVENKPELDEHNVIVQQYLQQTTAEHDTSLREKLKLPNNDNIANQLNNSANRSIAERWNETLRKDNTTIDGNFRDESAIPISQDTMVTQKILQGLTFIVSGFNGEDYIQVASQISGLGGKIIRNSYTGIPDYGVVPQFGAELKHTVNEVITDLFIEDCIDNEKLLDIEYYHKPITISKRIKPLKNCVIGMSTYSGAERTYLSRLSEALGARYQDTFARKTNLQKNTYSSTHLVCPRPQGEKYYAAIKWKLPAVTSEWLLQCAMEMKIIDENPYLVGETKAPERPAENIAESNSSVYLKTSGDVSNVKQSFMNQEQFMAGGCETPLINKRLNNLMNDKTPQSPFHVSTPETPYGQMFKENPSPQTRKGWVKWINHFPDVPVDEPLPKRRRSTPLSEVKRMAWDFVTGRLDNKETAEEENNKNETTVYKPTDNIQLDVTSGHTVTSRRLSFSDEASPPTTPANLAMNKQLEKLDKLLQKASNTPESRVSSLGSDFSNHYHLEPSLADGRCLMKESQPDCVGWEDPVRRTPMQEQSSDKAKKLKFMFSGIKDKSAAEKFITDLGGEVSTESAFDPTATHLLCSKPSRNEKVLSSIASGKWVLHLSYVEACINENRFLDEELFEMGNPKSKKNIPKPNNENEEMLMAAAHRWRLKLLKDSGGAFCKIVALLMTPEGKKDQFERLIKAGGGIVVEAKPPYNGSPSGRKINHCFIQKPDHPIDWAMLASKKIWCLPPNYLNDYLMAENELEPKDCVLQEFKKYLALMPE